MWSNVPLFPEQASTFAWRVDLLYTFLVGLSIFFSGLIFLLLVFFAVRYRRRSEDEQPRPILGSLRLEVLWTAIPLVLVMVIFAWGARLYFTTALPPDDAMEIYVVGLQWMWKAQHQEGQREINELHVPVGRPVKLIMTSQDVIHSFYVPAFRIKMDLVPGLYTTTWFEASKTGSFHLFCTEYCGTAHAGMVGRIVVLKPTDFENWLSGGSSAEPLALAGERLFQQLGCSGCHRVHGTVSAPALEGLYGSAVPLQSGDTVIADESYIRASILTPQRQIVAGYAPVMPSYQGQISEEGLLQLIAYIKSLGGEGQPGQRTER